jgi:hypothetical protein
MTIWCMRIACSVPKVTNAHTGCVIIVPFLLRRWLWAGSSVGIATDYGLGGPEIESRWGEIFRPSRPALCHTQPPVQWIPGLTRG